MPHFFPAYKNDIKHIKTLQNFILIDHAPNEYEAN